MQKFVALYVTLTVSVLAGCSDSGWLSGFLDGGRDDNPCASAPLTDYALERLGDNVCEPCTGALIGGDRLSGDTGETGDEPVDQHYCTPLVTAEFANTRMFCDGIAVDDAEHCTGDAVAFYGLPDFDIHTPATLTVKYDRIDVTGDGTYFYGPGTLYSGVPGIVEHPSDDGTDIALISRGCCSQLLLAQDSVLDPDSVYASTDWIPQHPDCQGTSLGTARETPMGWCAWAPSDDGGLCVYPCSTVDDCPIDESGMFCDYTTPDPMGQAPGVCRYTEIPEVPTQLADIGN